MLKVEAEVEESTKAEVRHLKARLVDADQEVCKLQDRLQEALNKSESTNSDLAHVKVSLYSVACHFAFFSLQERRYWYIVMKIFACLSSVKIASFLLYNIRIAKCFILQQA